MGGIRGKAEHGIPEGSANPLAASRSQNVPFAKAAPDGAGDTWTWTALDADSKLIVTYFVGGRDGECAMWFIDDLRSRLANRVQLTSDGHRAYLEAVEGAFGADIDLCTVGEALWRDSRKRQGPLQPSRMYGHAQAAD